jgi:hypothetical protein
MTTPQRLHLSSLLLLCVACATPYQPSGGLGGYSDLRLDEHVVQVRFRGNGYTNEERSADFCMLRCAELTLEHGCRYFQVIEEAQSGEVSSYTTPQTSHTTGSVYFRGNQAYGSATTQTYGGQTHFVSKPRSVQTIHCYCERPEGIPVVDAEVVGNSIRAKYDIGSPVRPQGSSPEPGGLTPGQG